MKRVVVVLALVVGFVLGHAVTRYYYLHLPPQIASLTVLGIVLGGFINLPLYRVNRPDEQPVMRGYMLPGLGWMPLPRDARQTIVAVNVGGCLVPAALAIFEAQAVADVPQARWAMVAAVIVNIAVCFWAARPIRGIGIAIPAFLPPLLAIGLAWLLLGGDTSELRAPVADLCAGLLGREHPQVGMRHGVAADLDPGSVQLAHLAGGHVAPLGHGRVGPDQA